jgi:hypothetical protein
MENLPEDIKGMENVKLACCCINRLSVKTLLRTNVDYIAKLKWLFLVMHT